MTRGPKNPERSFGLSVGGVLCLIAAVMAWRGRLGRAEALGGVGVVLVSLGLVRPVLLAWPSRLWWRFSLALGYVNMRVLLTVIFGLVFTPLSLIWRLTGKDPLVRSRTHWGGWSVYPARYRDSAHYRKMY